MKFLTYFFGTVFGIGYIPLAPGTIASVLATCAYYFSVKSFGLNDLKFNFLLIVLFFLGIIAGDFIEKDGKVKDPSFVVIDEVVGIMVTFWGLPIKDDVNFLYYVIAGCVLFRFFDILKPYPIRVLDTVRGGIGIMSDDFVAGMFSNFILKIAFFIIHVYYG